MEMEPSNNVSPNQAQPDNKFNPQEYDFIVNPAKPPSKSFLTGKSQTKMIIIFLSLVILVIAVVLIGINMLTSNDSTTESLVKVTQQQNELIRISTSSISKTKTEKAKQLATVSSMVITTDQKTLLTYLTKQKRKVNQKELALTKNKKADEILTTASNNGRYDEAFIQVMTELLESYQKTLQTNYDSVNDKGKEILKSSFDNVTLIISNNKKSQ